MNSDPYATLGVPHTATSERAREAFIRRARILNPERFDLVAEKSERSAANAMLLQLHEAYLAVVRINTESSVSPGSTRLNRPLDGPASKREKPVVTPKFEAIKPSAKTRFRSNKHRFSFFIFLAIGVPIIFLLSFISLNRQGVRPYTTVSQNDLEGPGFPYPMTGTEWPYHTETGTCPLTIDTSQDGDGMATFVKVLDFATNAPVTTFFIRPGGSCKVLVPIGTYRIKFAQGTQWYGPARHFGRHANIGMLDGSYIFDLKGNVYTGCELTLYPLPGGTIRRIPLTYDQF